MASIRIFIVSLVLLFGMSHLAMAATTVAVPNLDYKSKVRTFFYFEGATSHQRLNANNNSLNASEDDAYVKTYFDKIQISYGELRGMAADIRGLLIKNGFKVVNTSTHVSNPKQTDDFFNINKRIKAGEFKGAQYVLYGVVTSLDVQNGAEPIASTNTQMQINAVNMAVEFNLINTATLQTTASFTVLANANDNIIGNGSNLPSASKMVSDLGESLSQAVAEKLSDQSILPPGTPALTDTPPAPSSAPTGPVTVYKADE